MGENDRFGLNEIIIIGNVTREPEYKVYTNDFGVLRFSIAVNKSRKNKDTGEWEKKPQYFDIKCLGKTADLYNSKITKGLKVQIIGELEDSSFVSDAGETKRKISILAHKLFAIESRNQEVERLGNTPSAGMAAVQKAFDGAFIKEDIVDDFPF